MGIYGLIGKEMSAGQLVPTAVGSSAMSACVYLMGLRGVFSLAEGPGTESRSRDGKEWGRTLASQLGLALATS